VQNNNDLEVTRTAFEAATLKYFIAQREAGKAIDDNGSPATPEALFWRKENGDYGVEMFNAAWWGWKAALICSTCPTVEVEIWQHLATRTIITSDTAMRCAREIMQIVQPRVQLSEQELKFSLNSLSSTKGYT
jgi:hypothetical protein